MLRNRHKNLAEILYEITMNTVEKFREYKRINQVEHEVQKFKQDLVFSIFGLDDERFISARVAGGFVQSVTRRLGTLFEKYVKEIVKAQLNLSEEDIKYSAKIGHHIRDLEIMISLNKLEPKDRARIQRIILKEAQSTLPTKRYIGVGLEVRYAYTIGDSKRIQADEDMAVHLKNNDILPIMLVFSTVNLSGPLAYLSRYWIIKIGDDAFDFLKQLTEFDLKEFLLQYKDEIRKRVGKILNEVFRRQ